MDIPHNSQLSSCMIFVNTGLARYNVVDRDVWPLCPAVRDAPRLIIQASDIRRARLKTALPLYPHCPPCTHLPGRLCSHDM